MKPRLFRTWLEIDVKAIERNTKVLKALLSDEVVMMAVVKSNAYGHGMILSAKAALRAGADWLAVDEITEALDLRAAGIKPPILVLGYTLPEYFDVAAKKKISLTISSLYSLIALSKSKISKKLHIHLKFDTGLHRQGILKSYLGQAMKLISAKKFPGIVEGAYTHFAAMESPLKKDYSKMQAESFRNIVSKLKEKGFTPITHASASSGILFSKNFHFDMSRAGIALYGLWPSKEIRKWAKDIELSPALAWKTMVTEIKLVRRGSKVGYDLTKQLSRNSRLAIIPVGYSHGLPRSLSNNGQVLVNGVRADIVGRISMDMAIIDITNVPHGRPGDEVVILGAQRKERITAEEMAEWADTINYEIVTRINPQIPRILPLS